MNISGSGHIAAGEYNEKISVSGSGRINGNVRCIALSCSGSVRAEGSVECQEDIRVSGSGHFDKSISAESVSVSGAVRVSEDIAAKREVKISGGFHCGGSVRCAVLRCSGGAEIGKEAEAEEIRISGRINCAGLMNAERIDISIDGTNASSRIGSIGGSEIKIHNERKVGKTVRLPLLSKLVGAGGSAVIVDELIEGDVVAIECVRTPTVVGRVVAIGAGCDINLVQYSEEVEIDPDAKVGKCEKI